MARRKRCARLHGTHVAARLWGRRAEHGRGEGARGRDERARSESTAHRVRSLDDWTAALARGVRGTEEGAPARDREGRSSLVPGIFGARSGERPRQSADEGRSRWPRLRHQRLEDLDVVCRKGRLDVSLGTHGGERAKAGRHHLSGHGHGDAWCQGASHSPHQRRVAVLRDVFQRCPRPRDAGRWRREPRLGDGPRALGARAHHDRGHLQGPRRRRKVGRHGSRVRGRRRRPHRRPGASRSHGTARD